MYLYYNYVREYCVALIEKKRKPFLTCRVRNIDLKKKK